MAKVKSFRGQAIRKIEARAQDRLEQIGDTVVAQAEELTSTKTTTLGRDPASASVEPIGRPPGKRSGELTSSFGHTSVGRLQQRIGNTSKHALFTELGTGVFRSLPNDKGDLTRVGGSPIRPREKQVLKFEDIFTGETVFTKEVKGQRPRPSLLPALAEASGRIFQILRS